MSTTSSRIFDGTDVALGDKLYRKRNTPAIPLLVWRLKKLLEFHIPGDVPRGWKVRKISSAREAGVAMTCIEMEPGAGRTEICLDTAIGVALSYTARALGKDEMQRYDFGDYVAVGPNRYPRKISLQRRHQPRIEVRVDELAESVSFPVEVFAPPEGAQVHAWCSDPKVADKRQGPSLVPAFFRNGLIPKTVQFAAYLAIHPDGHVTDVVVLHSMGAALDKQLADTLRAWRFPSATCDGRPIDQETVIDFYLEALR